MNNCSFGCLQLIFITYLPSLALDTDSESRFPSHFLSHALCRPGPARQHPLPAPPPRPPPALLTVGAGLTHVSACLPCLSPPDSPWRHRDWGAFALTSAGLFRKAPRRLAHLNTAGVPAPRLVSGCAVCSGGRDWWDRGRR